MSVVVPGVAPPRTGILSWGYQRSPTHTHQGIDLHAPVGTPVYAAAGGVVDRVAKRYTSGFSGYGRVVVVEGLGGGVWFLYAHLDRIDVRVGQRVFKGQQLGTVGRTCYRKSEPEALCNRPHVHFEASPRPYPQGSEESRLDPLPWVQGSGAGVGGVLALLALGGAGVWWWRRRHR
jgi:murein DD-endopeptidase MepM/ murein hydrolase activator NlpD